MICCNYNSVSDSSTKFTRFGVSSYTCNLDFAVEYTVLHTVQINFHAVDVNKYRYIETPIGLLIF